MAKAALLLATFLLASQAAAQEKPKGTVDAIRDVPKWIAACWSPTSEGDEITLRLSFTRQGALIGRPRITYVHATNGHDSEAAVANSIFEALRACTPLPFSPAFGAVIAGQIFAIRFIAPRKTHSADARAFAGNRA